MADLKNTTKDLSLDILSSLDQCYSQKVSQEMERDARLAVGEIDSCLKDLAEWKAKRNNAINETNTPLISQYNHEQCEDLEDGRHTIPDHKEVPNCSIGTAEKLRELVAQVDELASATREIESERKMMDSPPTQNHKCATKQDQERKNDFSKFTDAAFDEYIARMNIELQCSEWMRESFSFPERQSSSDQLDLIMKSNIMESSTSCTVE